MFVCFFFAEPTIFICCSTANTYACAVSAKNRVDYLVDTRGVCNRWWTGKTCEGANGKAKRRIIISVVLIAPKWIRRLNSQNNYTNQYNFGPIKINKDIHVKEKNSY